MPPGTAAHFSNIGASLYYPVFRDCERSQNFTFIPSAERCSPPMPPPWAGCCCLTCRPPTQGRWIAAVNMSLQRGGTTEDMVQVCRPVLAEAASQIETILAKLGWRNG